MDDFTLFSTLIAMFVKSIGQSKILKNQCLGYVLYLSEDKQMQDLEELLITFFIILLRLLVQNIFLFI
jgi:hypothetical protein